MSIKRTLLFWLLAALAAISATFILGTYILERISIDHRQDQRLQQIALDVPEELKPADLHLINIKLIHGPDDFLLQIWKGNDPVYRSHTNVQLPRFADEGFSIHVVDRERWKTFGRRMGDYTIQVAQSLDARNALARERAFHLVIPLILFIPVLGLCIPLCVNAGLRSLRHISAELDARDPERLTPLGPENRPSEIAPVVEAVNTLLSRLQEAASHQQRFLADASHELRTPLAALQVQVQVVEQAGSTAERTESLAELKSSIKRTGHLVDQLLATSRLDANAAIDHRGDILLNELVREAIVRLEPIAARKGIDIGLIRDDRALIAGSGDEVMMLIQNLIDNAIRYTPSGGQVDLSIEADDGNAILAVHDSGPGIPDSDLHRVFDRFYRGLGHTVAGSGLGLAIVKRIADRHSACVDLRRSATLGGLAAIVTFSRDPVAA